MLIELRRQFYAARDSLSAHPGKITTRIRPFLAITKKHQRHQSDIVSTGNGTDRSKNIQNFDNNQPDLDVIKRAGYSYAVAQWDNQRGVIPVRENNSHEGGFFVRQDEQCGCDLVQHVKSLAAWRSAALAREGAAGWVSGVSIG